MDKIEVSVQLNNIFFDRLNIDFLNNIEIQKMNLFDDRVGIKPYELLYVFFDIEKTFDICFDDNDITYEKFSTFTNIANMIYEKRNIN